MRSRFTTALRMAAAFGILLLGACVSTAPTHYHTLLGDSAASAASATPSAFLIDVQSVGVPAQVDRPQLVVRDGGGVTPLEQERWIAPLADDVRSALSADLSRELATTDVASQPRPEGTKVLAIKVDLRRFDSAPGAYALIDAVWSLRIGNDASSALVCASEARETVAPGYDELVSGYRRALATIAGGIASVARNYVAMGKGACPGG
ncbi:MAG: PqiC family protein [Rudaea sp.]|uniref:PqiC family protein n=1 Tax=Rudaea sp. TaxID=2136325 RepID=UPI0039E3C73F